MIVHHVVSVSYFYRNTDDSLQEAINNVIRIEAKVGFNCVGIEKVYESGGIESMWLLLFETTG